MTKFCFFPFIFLFLLNSYLSQSQQVELSSGIRINQVGFYPGLQKIAIVEGRTAGPRFFVKSPDLRITYYTGSLSEGKTWPFSNEFVKVADFSTFQTPGTYALEVEGLSGKPVPFTIRNHAGDNLARASLKAFYFNRASVSLPAQFAGVWQRPAGHPDNKVMIHSSAATEARPAGTVVASPKGWYDAGDYNCYVVNSGITLHNLLSAYEHFSSYYDTLRLNIPESKNNLPDILDEAKWNIDWMLTMQDPNDGGVYHKKTTAAFCGSVMPKADTAVRYLVAKSTAATFDFAAVTAMAYRIYKKFDPVFAGQCLKASQMAYEWAIKHPDLYFKNPEGISTGAYGDNYTTDEKGWASAELYISTGSDEYYPQSFADTLPYALPGWANVRTLGLLSLLHHRRQLTAMGLKDTLAMKNKLITLANASRLHKAVSAYQVAMGTAGNRDFNWGGNSNALAYGLVNISAWLLTAESDFLHTALSSLDYVLGRNATGYCFVTGFGFKKVMDPHHRPSFADGVPEPVPGWVVGGPNTSTQHDCGASAYPSSTYRAIAYLDRFCSYSTNEVAINWNSLLVFVSGAFEAMNSL